jgi:hypothetical protein
LLAKHAYHFLYTERRKTKRAEEPSLPTILPSPPPSEREEILREGHGV